MEEGRIGTIPKSAMGRGMSRNYALIKVRNYSRKSGHVQSGNNALLSRHSPSRLSPFVRFTPRRSTRSFISTLLRLFQRSIKRRGTEERSSIPFHDPLDFVSHATFLQTFVFQRSVPISWSVYGVYTELACCFRDFVRHRGCKPILEGKWKTNIDGDGWCFRSACIFLFQN